jgi:predicted TIM-barrel fold metal-dependent hydrolase
MNGMKFSALRPSRRDFLTGLAALGAATLVPGAQAQRGQAPEGGQRGQGGQRGEAPPAPPPTGPAIGRRIDVHQHYVSPDYLAVLASQPQGTIGAQVANTFRTYTPARNIEEMDKAGVAVGMVSPTAPAAWFGNVEQARKIAREMNEYAAAKMVGAYKGRFGLFAVLPMPDVDGSLAEIAYAFDTLKADGVSFLTSYDNKWLGDKTFDPIFDELNRRNAVVYTHPLEAACCRNPLINSREGAGGNVSAQTLEYPTDTTRIIMNLIASNTATRCPNVKFIFSHAGGTLVSIAQRFLGAQVTADALGKPVEPNSRLHHVRRFYYDTAGSANPIQLQSLKLLVPASQIVLGTDFPFGNIPTTCAGVQTSGFSTAELQGIYRDNALKMLPQYS